MTRSKKIRKAAAAAGNRPPDAREAIDAITGPDPNRVNPFMARHGVYVDDHITDLSGELGPRNKVYPVTRNRGGTTIERWQANGSLSDAQVEAITLFARAWRMKIGEQRVVANWSLTGSIRGLPIEDWMNSTADAERLLEDMDKQVFHRAGRQYYGVWLNVVIFDEPAGVAGSRIGFTSKQAEAASKTIVMMLSNMIATAFRLGVAR